VILWSLLFLFLTVEVVLRHLVLMKQPRFSKESVEVTKEFVVHHQLNLNPRGEMYFIYVAQSERHISKWLVSIFPYPLPPPPQNFVMEINVMNLRNCKVRLSNIHCRGGSRGCKCAPFKNCAERLRYTVIEQSL